MKKKILSITFKFSGLSLDICVEKTEYPEQYMIVILSSTNMERMELLQLITGLLFIQVKIVIQTFK